MQNAPEAFLLLALPDSSLTLLGKTENGSLGLSCVTMSNPEAKEQRDIYLVLRVNATEVPIDPGRIVTRADTPMFRAYTFSGTQTEPTDISLRVKVAYEGSDSELSDKLEAFDSILEQYVTDFRRHGSSPGGRAETLSTSQAKSAGLGVTNEQKDLRGHLVLINEDNGEVIGEVQEKLTIREDPTMYEAGHQNDPVIIEIPEETTDDMDVNALEAFAHLIPPDQRNWITKSASIVSHAISMTTNLLVTTMKSATDLYISHSSPSPHHSAPGTNATAPKNKDPLSVSNSKASPTPPPLPPRPPRVLVFLTSEKTRKGLSTVHTMSGEAVKMSSKTLHTIDGMIRRAMGSRPRRDRYFVSHPGQTLASTSLPSANNYLLPTPPPPPPYETIEKSRSALAAPEKGKAPALPPRRSPSPVPPPLPPRLNGQPATAVAPIQPRLTTKERLVISADLIISTLDDSARKLLDSAPDSVGRIMAHKYGPEAAQASVLLAGTARNAGLVYVDMTGMGRRALLRRAGRTFVKARMSSNKPGPMRV